jgi:hypothetical protein
MIDDLGNSYTQVLYRHEQATSERAGTESGGGISHREGKQSHNGNLSCVLMLG